MFHSGGGEVDRFYFKNVDPPRVFISKSKNQHLQVPSSKVYEKNVVDTLYKILHYSVGT